MKNILSREQVEKILTVVKRARFNNELVESDSAKQVLLSHLALLDENAALKAECERMRRENEAYLEMECDRWIKPTGGYAVGWAIDRETLVKNIKDAMYSKCNFLAHSQIPF